LNMGLMLISKKYNKDNFSQTKMDRKTIKEWTGKYMFVLNAHNAIKKVGHPF
jgi:hypothetical protein